MTDSKADKSAYEEVLQDPTAFFDRPKDVLSSGDFSKDQKIEILKRWEFDATRLQESANEAMGGGETAPLAEVQECLRELEGDGN